MKESDLTQNFNPVVSWGATFVIIVGPWGALILCICLYKCFNTNKFIISNRGKHGL